MTLIAAAQANKLEKTSKVAEVSLRKLSCESHDFDSPRDAPSYGHAPPPENEDERSI